MIKTSNYLMFDKDKIKSRILLNKDSAFNE